MRADWPEEHSKVLAEIYPQGKSFSIMMDELNERLGTNYSRNSIIGRANRMFGPKNSRPTDTKFGRKPKVKAPPPKPKLVHIEPPRPDRAGIEMLCQEISPSGLTLMDLRPGQCRYPFGDTSITFCGHRAAEGSSYCYPHRLLCTRPSDHPRSGKPPSANWIASVRKANVPKSIALSSGDWEAS